MSSSRASSTTGALRPAGRRYAAGTPSSASMLRPAGRGRPARRGSAPLSVARSSVPKSQPRGRQAALRRESAWFARRSARLSLYNAALIVAFGQPPARAKRRTPAACCPPARYCELLFASSTYAARRNGSGVAFRPPLVRLYNASIIDLGSRFLGYSWLILGCKMGRYGDRDRRDDRRDHRSSGGGERRHDDRRRSRSRSRGRRRGRSRSRSRSYDRRRRRDHGATTCLAH